MVERTTGSRGIRKRSSRFLAPEQVPRFHCDFCKRDISRKISIKCADCADFDLCVECFAVGVEYQDHKKTHRYRVIDDLSFAVFSSSWGADEELLFFDGICDFGISDWEAVAHVVGSKSAEACKRHYLEKQHWMDDASTGMTPVATKDVKGEAFPMEIGSEAFGTSPRSCSPVSDAGWSFSSDSVEDEPMSVEQEWIFPVSLETSKSSPAEGVTASAGVTSDVEGLMNEIDTEAETKDEDMPLADGTPLTDSPIKGNGFVEEMMSEEGVQGESQEGEPLLSMAQMPGGKRQKTAELSTPSLNRPAAAPPQPTPGLILSSFDTNAGEVTGYNPFRREFDPPYDVGAEQMIADLDFVEDDPEEVTKAKLKLLHLYRWRVHEREQRTEELKQNRYGLLDVRKIMAMERAWSANEKFAELRPFARYAGLEKAERLAKGLCFERTIRRRLQELQEVRRHFAQRRLELLLGAVIGVSYICRDPFAHSAQLIGKWRRCHPEIVGSGIHLATLPDLNDREKKLCSEVGFSPWQFAVLRDRLLREVEENQGRFSKMLVRSFFRLDTAQAVKLFEFLVAEGRIVNSDRETKEPKKATPTDEIPSQEPIQTKSDREAAMP